MHLHIIIRDFIFIIFGHSLSWKSRPDPLYVYVLVLCFRLFANGSDLFVYSFNFFLLFSFFLFFHIFFSFFSFHLFYLFHFFLTSSIHSVSSSFSIYSCFSNSVYFISTHFKCSLKESGEYMFCFSNKFSTFTGKTIFMSFESGKKVALFHNQPKQQPENDTDTDTDPESFMDDVTDSIYDNLLDIINGQTQYRLVSVIFWAQFSISQSFSFLLKMNAVLGIAHLLAQFSAKRFFNTKFFSKN